MLRSISIVIVTVFSAVVSLAIGLQSTFGTRASERGQDQAHWVTFADWSSSSGYKSLSIDDRRLIEGALGLQVGSLTLTDLVVDSEGSGGVNLRVAVVDLAAAALLDLRSPAGDSQLDRSVFFAHAYNARAVTAGETLAFKDSKELFTAAGTLPVSGLPVSLSAVDAIVVDDRGALLDDDLARKLTGDAQARFRDNQPNRVLFSRIPREVLAGAYSDALADIQEQRTHAVTWETPFISAKIGTRSGKAVITEIEGFWPEVEWRDLFSASSRLAVLIIAVVLLVGLFSYGLVQVLRSTEKGRRTRILAHLGASEMHLVRDLFRSEMLIETGTGALFGALLAVVGLEAIRRELDVPAYLLPEVGIIAVIAVIAAIAVSTFAGVSFAAWTAIRTRSGKIFQHEAVGPGVALFFFATLAAMSVVSIGSVAPSLVDVTNHDATASVLPLDELYVVETQYTQFPPPLSGLTILESLQEDVEKLGAPGPAVALIGGLPPLATPLYNELHAVGKEANTLDAVRVLGSTHFFEVANMKLLHGKTFAEAEAYGLVITRSLSLALYGSEDGGVGRGLIVKDGNQIITFNVIGVVEDVPNFPLTYFRNTDISATSQMWTSTLLIRTDSTTEQLASRLHEAMPLLGLEAVSVEPLREVVDRKARPLRIALYLLASLTLAVVTILLVALGSVVVGIVGQSHARLNLLWRLGASPEKLISRPVGSVVLAWLVGAGAGAVILNRDAATWQRLTTDTAVQGYAALGFVGACLIVIICAILAAYSQTRRTVLLQD